MFNNQSQNVQYLRKIIYILNKDINNAIKRSDNFEIEMKTKILALTYSAWSEAQFTQILYTPNSFTQNEIDTILSSKKRNLEQAWTKLIETSLSKASGLDNNAVKSTLIQYVKTYIITPSEVRNKLAHGQWKVALNSPLTSTNNDMTKRIDELNVVSIMIEFHIHTILGKIIRDLVNSSNFTQAYSRYITELENYINKTKTWTYGDKKARLDARKRI